MAKKTAKSADPTFETALAELEDIIAGMEGDQLPLDELVTSYEKGAQLLKHCEQVLARAKKRIQVVQLADSGEKELESGGKQAEDPETPPTADDADDIRLL
jgi:exodeoxyribonuclease VII small subunit